MPSDWYLMSRPLFNSGFEKDEFEDYSQDGFLELLDSFISTEMGIYKNNNFEDETVIKGIVQNVTSDNENYSFVRQVLVPIGSLKTGYYIKYNGDLWLAMTPIDNNKIYEKTIIYKCNYKLKFINKNKEIFEYPVFMKNATQYNSGESANEYLTIGSSKYLIFIMCDKETITINHGKRFLIDRNLENPTAFEITQVDTVSYNFDDVSVLRWTVVESQFSPKTDNKELMIADYYDKQNSNEGWL